MLASTRLPTRIRACPIPSVLLAPTGGATLVPPDPLRRYVSKPQMKSIYGANGTTTAHGFGFVDPAENAASNGSAVVLRVGSAAGARLPLHRARHGL